MKKIFVTVALLFAGITVSLADNDRPITLEQLPAPAQTFLKTHFADLTLAYAVEDPKLVGSEYEVTYTDRTEVEFRSNGEWSSVVRKYAAVPASIVPTQISAYVAKSSFPNQFIKKIERNSYTWEIELSNGIEKLRFNQAVTVGSEVRLRATLLSLTNLRGIAKAEIKVALEIRDCPKTAMDATVVFLYHFK